MAILEGQETLPLEMHDQYFSAVSYALIEAAMRALPGRIDRRASSLTDVWGREKRKVSRAKF